MRAAGALLAIVALLALAGCGDDGDDAAQETGSEAGVETTSTEAASQDDQAKQDYIRKADAICRQSFREAREVARSTVIRVNPEGSVETLTDILVKPGLPVLDRFQARLEALQPRPDDPDLDAYLGLFDTGRVMLDQRLQAGREGDEEEARNLETLLVDVGEEQRAHGRRFGFKSCDQDFLDAYLSGFSR